VTSDRPALFIGSSSEGEHVAECLQSALESACEPTVWSQGVFGLGGTTLSTLVKRATECECAVLVLTADDIVEKRGRSAPTVRDNVLFEAGLFIGALGIERTFLVMCRDEPVALPTDLAGLTAAFFNRRKDGNVRAAVNPAALEIKRAMRDAGPKRRVPTSHTSQRAQQTAPLTLAEERQELDRELDAVSRAVAAQGGRVKTRTTSAYRVIAPDGEKLSLTLGRPHEARADLRELAAVLNAKGVRLTRAVLPEGTPPAPARRRPRTERGTGRAQQRKRR
jgi:hypothetical protein